MSRILVDEGSAPARGYRYRQKAEEGPEPGVHPLVLRDTSRNVRVKDETSEPPPERNQPQPEPAEPAVVETYGLEAARAEAHAQGLEEGRQQAESAFAEQWGPLLSGLSKTVQQLAGLKRQLRQETEAEIVDLVFAVARRILHRELTVDPAAVRGIVRSCLDAHSNAEVQHLRMHPDDIPLIQEAMDASELPQLNLIADESIGRGGAVFETSRGHLDARIDSQLREIANGIADR